MKNEASRFIGTVMEYEAPFDAVKNATAATMSTSVEPKSNELKHESSNEKNENVL